LPGHSADATVPDVQKRKALLVLAVVSLGAGAAALGCGAAGVGFGSLGLAVAGFVVWALLAGSASSGCYSSYRDDDAAGDIVETGVCLAPPADADIGPCLGALPDVGACLRYDPDEGGAMDVGPCLEPPADVGVCLNHDPDVGVCLAYDPDAVPAEVGPCLSAPAEDAAGELPICPPELCDVCLNSPIDWCILDCPPPGADVSASLGSSPDAGGRLAAAGVLSPDQLARLRKLAGRG
jgi:hypothetical protein